MYHTGYIITDLDETVLMPGGHTFNGTEWETEDNVKVIEWLDESLPATPCASIEERAKEYYESLRPKFRPKYMPDRDDIVAAYLAGAAEAVDPVEFLEWCYGQGYVKYDHTDWHESRELLELYKQRK